MFTLQHGCALAWQWNIFFGINCLSVQICIYIRKLWKLEPELNLWKSTNTWTRAYTSDHYPFVMKVKLKCPIDGAVSASWSNLYSCRPSRCHVTMQDHRSTSFTTIKWVCFCLTAIDLRCSEESSLKKRKSRIKPSNTSTWNSSVVFEKKNAPLAQSVRCILEIFKKNKRRIEKRKKKSSATILWLCVLTDKSYVSISK